MVFFPAQKKFFVHRLKKPRWLVSKGERERERGENDKQRSGGLLAWNDTTNKEHDMMGKNWK